VNALKMMTGKERARKRVLFKAYKELVMKTLCTAMRLKPCDIRLFLNLIERHEIAIKVQEDKPTKETSL
jgi:hypothetical protein